MYGMANICLQISVLFVSLRFAFCNFLTFAWTPIPPFLLSSRWYISLSSLTAGSLSCLYGTLIDTKLNLFFWSSCPGAGGSESI